MVKLYHSESSSYMGCDVSYFGKNPEVFLRSYSGEEMHEICGPNYIWEIDIIGMNDRGRKLRIGSEKKQDETVQISEKIRLRHFVTGRLLSITSMLNTNTIVISKLEKDSKDQYTEIQFEPLVRDLTSVEAGRSYYIRTARGTFGISEGAVLSRDIITNRMHEYHKECKAKNGVNYASTIKFYPGENSTFDEVKIRMGLDELGSQEAGFLIKKLTKEEQGEV